MNRPCFILSKLQVMKANTKGISSARSWEMWFCMQKGVLWEKNSVLEILQGRGLKKKFMT